MFYYTPYGGGAVSMGCKCLLLSLSPFYNILCSAPRVQKAMKWSFGFNENIFLKSYIGHKILGKIPKAGSRNH